MITYTESLTRSQLARELGVDRTTLWRYERAGRLPAPTVVSGKRSELPPEAQMIAADLVAGSAGMTGRFDNDPVKRAEGRRQAAAGRVAEFDAALAALKAAKPDPTNFEAAVSHQERVAAQEVRVCLAREALTAADADLKAARSTAADRDARARHARAQKDAEEAEALVRAIDACSRLLAKKLTAVKDHKQRNAAVNAELGGRLGFIVDGETRVRGTPAHTVPAVFGDQTVWRLSDGSRPTFYAHDKSGDLVPSDQGARKVVERVEIRPEVSEPATAPKSFLDTIKLPSLDGRSMIWGTP